MNSYTAKVMFLCFLLVACSDQSSINFECAQAIYLNRYEEVDKCLRRNVNKYVCEGASCNYKTPIVFSVIKSGDTKMLNLFFKHNVDLASRNSNGMTLFDYAAYSGQLGMLSALLEKADYSKYKSREDLVSAAWNMSMETDEKIQMIELLLKHGADPSEKGINGQTVLDQIIDFRECDVAQFIYNQKEKWALQVSPDKMDMCNLLG